MVYYFYLYSFLIFPYYLHKQYQPFFHQLLFYQINQLSTRLIFRNEYSFYIRSKFSFYFFAILMLRFGAECSYAYCLGPDTYDTHQARKLM